MTTKKRTSFTMLVLPKCEAITKHPVRSKEREASGRCLRNAKYLIEGHKVCWHHLWAVENKNRPLEFVEPEISINKGKPLK